MSETAATMIGIDLGTYKIKCDAEADFNPIGRTVDEAVITVPAYFDPLHKQETERAALDAGFQRVFLLPEPTAAASAYRIKVAQENQYVVVIDLGAGTLDVTVALLYLDANGQLQTVEKSHGGDTALGGLDMDDALLASVARRFGLGSLLKDPQAGMRLAHRIGTRQDRALEGGGDGGRLCLEGRPGKTAIEAR